MNDIVYVFWQILMFLGLCVGIAVAFALVVAIALGVIGSILEFSDKRKVQKNELDANR